MYSAQKIPCDGIIFDCDGVLFDSNSLKVEAFRNVLSSYPEDKVDKFIKYHIKEGGISRYKKIETFLVEILDTPFEKKIYEQLLMDYGRECEALYQRAMLTPHCLEVLNGLVNIIPLYVASGSDESELRNVFRLRNIDEYFVNIFGSPKTKQQCLREIVSEVGTSKNLVMVGDSKADWDAARQLNMSFVYMFSFSENYHAMMDLASKKAFSTISTLKELTSKLDLR